MKSQNTTLERSHVGLEERQQSNDHKAHVIWLTGLSGSGKSTISRELESRLFQKGQQVYILDGDNIRNGLNGDLGFTKEDRIENIRRIAHVANLFYKAGFIVICAFISPQKEMRDFVRDIFPGKVFSEVYVKCSLDTCKERDPKKLYERAISGEIKEFTGISAPYKEPDAAELVLNTDKLFLEECLGFLENYIEQRIV